MPRESIALTRDELLAFLGEEQRCILGTLDADGRPWPDAVACLLRGDLLYIRVATGSRSHHNIQCDTRVCAVFERFPTYYEIKGATVHGRALAVSGGHAFDAVPDPVAGAPVDDAQVYQLALDDVVSFEFSKIKNRVTS